jgi:hypothetical protein
MLLPHVYQAWEFCWHDKKLWALNKMGLGLSHPITSKRLYRIGNSNYKVGMATMHGIINKFSKK